MTHRTDPHIGVSPAARMRALADVDGLASAVADGLEAEYVQLEAKPFAAQWTVVSLSEIVLQFAWVDVAVVRRIRIPAERWAFLVPLAVPESARWNARPVTGNELMLCAPESDCYAFDPGGTEFAIISVPKQSVAVALTRAFLTPAAGNCSLLPRARDAQTLQHLLRRTLSRVAVHEVFDSAALGVQIGDALETCLKRGESSDRYREPSTGRSRIVRRAEEFFRTHVGERVSMAQLSSNAMVSERSLREAFYDMYAISPKRYFRLWQLHQVRRALRSLDRRDATVTDLATLHGFYELGRFAGEYKAFFGEAPSQTLHRARQSVDSGRRKPVHTTRGGRTRSAALSDPCAATPF